DGDGVHEQVGEPEEQAEHGGDVALADDGGEEEEHLQREAGEHKHADFPRVPQGHHACHGSLHLRLPICRL
ncbi:Os07g0154900, partial [Oryza sativa Japonica Group]